MASADVAPEANKSVESATTAFINAEGDNGIGNDGGDEDSNRQKQLVRKRTKTGCLTCRKRRIKCDEGRPICHNCIKSKRNCEGYNQRVIFKDPIGAFSGGSYGPVVFPPESSQRPFVPVNTQQSKQQSQVSSLAAIAPKPPAAVDFQHYSAAPYGQPPFIEQPAPAASSTYCFGQNARYDYDPLLANPSLTPSTGQFYHHQGQQEPGQPYLTPPSGEVPGVVDAGHQPSLGLQTPNPAQPQVVMLESVTIEAGPSQNHIPQDADWTYLSEDDAAMGDSDDEYEVAGREDNYRTLIQSHMDGPLEGVGTTMRTFSSFAQDDVLTSYIPNAINSPLNDSKTAALFWHFVNVTGPSMSLYERHPFDHNDRPLAGNPSTAANQNIWTYTFPIIAFNHPALLQSMLAIGALQIAKLQSLPETAALKHYHLAIRRIARNVKSHARRTQPATIASILLLAYFEVWNSEHTKWSQHLLGARLLIKEVDFREMTRNIIPLKRAKRALFEQERRRPLDPFFMGHDSGAALQHDLDDIDHEFVGRLSGHEVRYEDDRPLSGMYYTDRDIEHYEHLRDLYWWYTKMDVYLALLSGCKPFMEYKHRTQCPPRAPMGRLEAIYGTYDHLVLVLARLMTFAGGDLPRKRKAMQKYGFMGGPPGAAGRGQPRGRPQEAGGRGGPTPGIPPSLPPGMGPPGMGPPGGMGPPPGAMPPGMRPAAQSQGPPAGMPPGMFGGGGAPGGSPPMFPGMLPTQTDEVRPPRGFSPPRERTPPEERLEDVDLEAATAAAMKEWEEIRVAFEVLRENFGPEFEPLGPEYADRRDSPFGPTLQYRTFSVAGVWMNYYMGLVHLYRAHPMMPPAAMIAQGIQAAQTARYAIEIGRIAAGLCDDLIGVTEISTLVGAALVESSLPLFVCGIQLQDNVQRQWIIRRLHDVARLTGWQSSRQIAEGCEAAWNKAAAMGKGPPYVRDEDLVREIPKPLWAMDRRIQTRIEQLDSEQNKLVVARPERAAYAIGLLSVEKELERMDLKG